MPLPAQNGLNMMRDSRCQKKEPFPLQHLQRMKISPSHLFLKKVGMMGLSTDADTLIGDTVIRPMKHLIQVIVNYYI